MTDVWGAAAGWVVSIIMGAVWALHVASIYHELDRVIELYHAQLLLTDQANARAAWYEREKDRAHDLLAVSDKAEIIGRYRD